MIWLILLIIVAILIVVALFFETRGTIDRTEKKLDEVLQVLLELRDNKTSANAEEQPENNSPSDC